MPRRLVFALFILMSGVQAMANDGDYAVARIAPSLLKNADAVLRAEELWFEVISLKEAVQRHHYVITVLNENGDQWARFLEYYDQWQDVSSIQGYLYDAFGNQVKKLKPKDIEDIKTTDGYSLMEDGRVKRHDFYCKTYPYTIEYDVQIRCKHTMFFPTWAPQSDEKLSVEKSQVTIICPEDYEFRYKAYNYPGDPVVTAKSKKRLSTWAVKNLPAILKEVYQPPLQEITTVVLFGPTDFQLGDYKGRMTNWSDLGKFQNALNRGRDVLPDNIKAKVHQLVDGIADEKKKIQVLYEYMQKNTRYVSIQLGIGGWQPFDAAFVASKSYGDCKALSNYMYSLLKEAGIRSCYTLVRAGEDEQDITEVFPSDQFNHVILCVPLKADTIWLECTSQTLPAGYMGGFTGNRAALAMDENGGTLVRTPRYGLNENTELTKIRAVLSDDATLQIKAESVYKGMQQDNLHRLINRFPKDKIKEWLHRQFDFATYDINDFNYVQENGPLPAINEWLDITVSNYATITGKRIFIVPNMMTRADTKLAADTARHYDIQVNTAYRMIDTVEIELPKGYATEAMPEDLSVDSKFGKYKCCVILKDNKLLYYRSVERYSGHFPATDYNDLVKFVEVVYKADHNRVVLVKNEKQDDKKAF